MSCMVVRWKPERTKQCSAASRIPARRSGWLSSSRRRSGRRAVTATSHMRMNVHSHMTTKSRSVKLRHVETSSWVPSPTAMCPQEHRRTPALAVLLTGCPALATVGRASAQRAENDGRAFGFGLGSSGRGGFARRLRHRLYRRDLHHAGRADDRDRRLQYQLRSLREREIPDGTGPHQRRRRARGRVLRRGSASRTADATRRADSPGEDAAPALQGRRGAKAHRDPLGIRLRLREPPGLARCPERRKEVASVEADGSRGDAAVEADRRRTKPFDLAAEFPGGGVEERRNDAILRNGAEDVVTVLRRKRLYACIAVLWASSDSAWARCSAAGWPNHVAARPFRMEKPPRRAAPAESQTAKWARYFSFGRRPV